VPWSEATRTFPTRARSSRGTSNVRQVSNLRASLTFLFSCSERLKKMRQHFHAARRGSQSAYQAGQRFTIATSASGFSRRARRFKPSTLKAVFAGKRPATLNAAEDERTTRDLRRAFPAPTFSNCGVGQAGSVTARPVRPVAVRQHRP